MLWHQKEWQTSNWLNIQSKKLFYANPFKIQFKRDNKINLLCSLQIQHFNFLEANNFKLGFSFVRARK